MEIFASVSWNAALSTIYWRFLVSHRRHLLLAFSLVLLSCSANVAAPYVFSLLIDSSHGSEHIVIGFGCYAAIRGLAASSAYISNYIALVAAENLNVITATAFFDRITEKTPLFYVDHSPVEIQAAGDKGQRAAYVAVQLLLVIVIPGLLQLILAIALLGAVINFETVGIVLLYGAAFVTATFFANRATRRYLEGAIETSQTSARFLGNAMNAMETLRYFNADRWASDVFSGLAAATREAWRTWANRRMWFATLFGIMLALQFAATYYLLVPSYQAGTLSVGDIVLINSLLLQLNRPFEMMGAAIDEIVKAWVSFQPFLRMWNAPDGPGPCGHDTFELDQGRIDFENVSFDYGASETFTNLTFSAERGRITFLMGKTGAGKSTVFKVALKTLIPKSGRVLVDGNDLAGISRRAWLAQVGVVPQDVMLFNDSIANNIVLGRPLRQDRLSMVCGMAALDQFLRRLPDGLSTTVGERGLKLSGGERQRIAIARALYDDPKLLFLDEASSALDEGTEADIMNEIRRLATGMTVLVITHRKSVVAKSDAVITLP